MSAEETVEEALMSLYQMGLVKVEYDENLEAWFTLTLPNN